jgi:hypothetical protein
VRGLAHCLLLLSLPAVEQVGGGAESRTNPASALNLSVLCRPVLMVMLLSNVIQLFLHTGVCENEGRSGVLSTWQLVVFDNQVIICDVYCESATKLLYEILADCNTYAWTIVFIENTIVLTKPERMAVIRLDESVQT